MFILRVVSDFMLVIYKKHDSAKMSDTPKDKKKKKKQREVLQCTLGS